MLVAIDVGVKERITEFQVEVQDQRPHRPHAMIRVGRPSNPVPHLIGAVAVGTKDLARPIAVDVASDRLSITSDSG